MSSFQMDSEIKPGLVFCISLLTMIVFVLLGSVLSTILFCHGNQTEKTKQNHFKQAAGLGRDQTESYVRPLSILWSSHHRDQPGTRSNSSKFKTHLRPQRKHHKSILYSSEKSSHAPCLNLPDWAARARLIEFSGELTVEPFCAPSTQDKAPLRVPLPFVFSLCSGPDNGHIPTHFQTPPSIFTHLLLIGHRSAFLSRKSALGTNEGKEKSIRPLGLLSSTHLGAGPINPGQFFSTGLVTRGRTTSPEPRPAAITAYYWIMCWLAHILNTFETNRQLWKEVKAWGCHECKAEWFGENITFLTQSLFPTMTTFLDPHVQNYWVKLGYISTNKTGDLVM